MGVPDTHCVRSADFFAITLSQDLPIEQDSPPGGRYRPCTMRFLLPPLPSRPGRLSLRVRLECLLEDLVERVIVWGFSLFGIDVPRLSSPPSVIQERRACMDVHPSSISKRFP